MPENTVEKLLTEATQRHRAGDLAAAEAAYQRILAIEPTHPSVLHLLGIIEASRGALLPAIELFEAATRAKPDYAEAYYNLGKALQDSGQRYRAVESYTHAVTCRPTYAKALNNRGVVFQELREFDHAMRSYDQAIKAQPNYPEALFNRATLLEMLGRIEEAVVGYRAAIELRPGYVDALTNLGNAFQKAGRFDEAIDLLSKIEPASAISLNALGNALKEVGRLDEALTCYRDAVSAGGGHWAAGNYLYAMHFDPQFNSRRIFEEHVAWNDKYARPLMPVTTPHVRNGDRLKVGFVSPNLRQHPVGRLMLPLSKHLDSSRFEAFYFSDAIVEDEVSNEIDRFLRPIHNRSDAELADDIRSLNIDVLIDLTMHMDNNRLRVFARRPAPLQLTYLAYCSTTGLTAIDYRLSDPHLDPPGTDLSIYSEKTLRLAHTYWCYRQPKEWMPLAKSDRRHIVFGCFNNYCKIADPTWDAWLEILETAPKSRLVIFCPEGRHRTDAINRIRKGGIDPNRLSMVGRMPQSEYFKMYNQIDVALDPFPYGGGTTSLDALWMGVPVVSLVGQTAVGRGGSTILNNLGAVEWLATDVTQYVSIARAVANNLPDRSALRGRLSVSRLMNEPGFSRDFESAIACAWLERAGEAV